MAQILERQNISCLLGLLKRAKLLESLLRSKSRIIVGLGESRQEAFAVLADLKQAGYDLVAKGRSLQLSLGHYMLARYVLPDEFEEYQRPGIRHRDGIPLWLLPISDGNASAISKPPRL